MNGQLFDMMEEYLKKIKNTNVSVDTGDNTFDFNPFHALLHISMQRNSGISVINGGTYYRIVPNEHAAKGRLEVRVGDYDRNSVSHMIFHLPFNFDKRVSEVLLKRAANEAIWNSIETYLGRLIDSLGVNNGEGCFLSISDEEPSRYIQNRWTPKRRLSDLQENLEKVTRALYGGEIISCNAEFDLMEKQRYIANTKESMIYTKDAFWELSLNLRTIDSDNRVLSHSQTFKGKGSRPYITLDELMEAGERLAGELSEIRKAEIEKNGTYPAIMDPENHGVIWHEVVGHSLEGHRQQEGEWGDTANLFADRMGEKVAPGFITLTDDPTREDLFAHYKFDDEGIPGQKVVLIEKGILKDFLHSRESAGFMDSKSNGHARAENSNMPVPRMSNLIVESSKQMSYDELKENLIKECRRQRKPYGLIMSGSNGGVTLPSDSMFNTYPINVFRVYAKNGETERVRGIYLVGTPAQALDNMVATSDRFDTFNGFCGAESGSIPSTVTAPDMLLKRVEVNRIPSSSYDVLKNEVLPE